MTDPRKDPTRCKQMVWSEWSSHQCASKAKKDGYCMTHHPDRVAAKRAAREAKWDAESKARSEQWAVEGRRERVGIAVEALTDAERDALPESVRAAFYGEEE